ncbi:MAG: tRNA lysidine(34) synthetase TilS [Bacteroidaceae bacterium]|nr:tRNA lysidine(34) synthetase TilS [Bacteroidaceae bacterium]
MLSNIVRQSIDNECDAHDGIIVALSGGADSVALLLCLRESAEKVCAAHCNFHLRGEESDRDERFCRDLCQRLGVPIHVCHFNTLEEAEKRGVSVEMAARDLRYEWFARLRNELNYGILALAHHRDDNVETLLQHIAHGCGIHGLTGMPQRRDCFVRPLLNVSRREILEYLEQKGQDFVNDSTNTDTAYQRNLVRHELLPLLERLNPNIRQTLAEMMEKMRESLSLYEESVDAWRTKLTRLTADGLEIRLDELRHMATAKTLLHEFLLPFGFTQQDEVNMLQARTGAVFCSENYMATVAGDLLVCDKKPVSVPLTDLVEEGETFLADGTSISLHTAKDVSIERGNPLRVTIDKDKICGKLCCRTIEQGDRFHPFGMKGTKLVSDFLTERHIHRIARMKTKVVTDDCGIIWLVGHRIDQRVAVTADTLHVSVLEIR